MLSASLKEVITIEKRTESFDTLGSVTETWATLGQRRAQVFHNTGRKTWESDLNDSIHDFNVVFQFRHIDGLNFDCRIVFDDEVYVILDIEKLRRREGYRVTTNRRENT